MGDKKRKICLVTGNRAEYTHAKTIIREIIKHSDLELLLVVMGSHLLDKYGLTIKDIELDGFPINYRIFMELDGKEPCTMAKSVGVAMGDMATYFENIKPDLVIAMADRYEIIAVATVAALMNIPIAHIQGGEVTGTIDESTRHVITKWSHIHFPSSEKSKERIIKMGERPEMVFNVGDPGTDLLLEAPVWTSEETLNYLNKQSIKDNHLKLDSLKPFILILQHPVTTEFGSGFDQIQETLYALKNISDSQLHQLIMLWPNIDAGSDDISRGIRWFQLKYNLNMIVIKHVPSAVFINLMRNAKCMVGNSSSGIKETCYFGTPTVNVGTRQQERERGSNVVDVPYDRHKIYEAITAQINHGKYKPEFLFGDGTSGKKISAILAEIDLKGMQIQKRITY